MSNRKQVDQKTKLDGFLKQVNEAIETGKMFLLRNFIAQEEYFEMLKTDVLGTLSQQTKKQIEAGGDYPELQLLLDRILLRIYLLSGRFSDFRKFTKASGIETPTALEQLLDNWDDEEESYQSQTCLRADTHRQVQLIKGLAELECHDELFKSLRRDVRAQFTEHQSSIHVATTVEHKHPLIRPAITFMISSDKSKVTTTHDFFLSAQKIDERFRQTAEEIQDAMQLTNDDGSRYWYRLYVFQELVKNGEILLDGRSAGAAIGWLIFSLEENIAKNKNLHTPLLSVWGEYDAYRKQFRPVDALREKLDACVEDGIRIVAVPKATLERRIRPDTSFKDYAKQQKVHLIAFPDDMPIFDVYSCILESYQGLNIEPITKDKTQDVDTFRLGRNQEGELLQDQTGEIYWAQTKKFHIPNPDVISHMKVHKMPGWRLCRKVDFISRIPGPPFYFTDLQSNGLLIKFHRDVDVFLIDNAQKRKFSDEYSYENYRYQGGLLEWGDIISVTEEIIQEFPTGSPIQITPNLNSPVNGATFTGATVTLCCKPHPNKIWEYHFQIADKQDFSAPMYEDVGGISLVINNLMPGEYWWRMRGIKQGREPSAWSETRAFTIVPPR